MNEFKVEVTDRSTIRVNTPSITVDMLKQILSGEPDDAQVTFATGMGGSQRDPYPVSLTITVNRSPR